MSDVGVEECPDEAFYCKHSLHDVGTFLPTGLHETKFRLTHGIGNRVWGQMSHFDHSNRVPMSCK